MNNISVTAFNNSCGDFHSLLRDRFYITMNRTRFKQGTIATHVLPK